MDCLVKTDVSSRAATIWAPPQSHTPGEAIFVPRPNATDEDDGVLLVGCKDCSLWLRVLFAPAGEDEDDDDPAEKQQVVHDQSQRQVSGSGSGFRFNFSFNLGVSIGGSVSASAGRSGR